jgi:2-polyprenyl-3-methyl-5-hydroxy-6-metoxy-1,4-benzoquinol methylase
MRLIFTNLARPTINLPRPTRFKLAREVSSFATNSVGDVGRYIPAFSSALRPRATVELREWGGPPLVRGKRILDLGCGDGRFALGVAPIAMSVDGLDPDSEAIAAAKNNARKAGVRNVRFAAGAAQRLPYRDATFDVVILSWTL